VLYGETADTNLIFSALRKYEDTKRVVRSCNMEDRQYNGQRKKDKQWSTKYYTEN
jgi:hypothetical protein